MGSGSGRGETDGDGEDEDVLLDGWIAGTGSGGRAPSADVRVWGSCTARNALDAGSSVERIVSTSLGRGDHQRRVCRPSRFLQPPKPSRHASVCADSRVQSGGCVAGGGTDGVVTYSAIVPRRPESVTTGASRLLSQYAIWSLMNSAVTGSFAGCASSGSRSVACRRSRPKKQTHVHPIMGAGGPRTADAPCRRPAPPISCSTPGRGRPRCRASRGWPSRCSRRRARPSARRP